MEWFLRVVVYAFVMWALWASIYFAVQAYHSGRPRAAKAFAFWVTFAVANALTLADLVL